MYYSKIGLFLNETLPLPELCDLYVVYFYSETPKLEEYSL